MILLVALATIAAPAHAAEPVTLRCVLEGPPSPRPLDLTLNETEGTATFYWPNNGQTVKRPAAFAPTKVTFGRFTVDRVTLSIQMENDSSMVADGTYPPVSAGKCQLQKVDRAF